MLPRGRNRRLPPAFGAVTLRGRRCERRSHPRNGTRTPRNPSPLAGDLTLATCFEPKGCRWRMWRLRPGHRTPGRESCQQPPDCLLCSHKQAPGLEGPRRPGPQATDPSTGEKLTAAAVGERPGSGAPPIPALGEPRGRAPRGCAAPAPRNPGDDKRQVLGEFVT